MATTSELMAHGLPSGLANGLGSTYASALVATGTNQATALALTASMSVFATVSSGKGALLPASVNKPPQVIYNGGSNALTVYPSGSNTVNGTTSFSVTNGKTAVFFQFDGGWIANLSA